MRNRLGESLPKRPRLSGGRTVVSRRRYRHQGEQRRGHHDRGSCSQYEASQPTSVTRDPSSLARASSLLRSRSQRVSGEVRIGGNTVARGTAHFQVGHGKGRFVEDANQLALTIGHRDIPYAMGHHQFQCPW